MEEQYILSELIFIHVNNGRSCTFIVASTVTHIIALLSTHNFHSYIFPLHR